MKHLGLFAGIGGFELAAKWMGWETVAWCEIEPFCQKVLRYHFPEAVGYNDIKETDFTHYANSIDILTGGFPCQPFSTAGKKQGTEDNRYLWPEMLRAIREVSPRWIVGENVRGLTNWNGGVVFDQVQADLENEGYQVTPFLLPACAVNAPHRRDRIWFVAYSNSIGQQRQREYQQPLNSKKTIRGEASWINIFYEINDVANSNNSRREQGNEKNAGGSSEQFNGDSFQYASNTSSIGLDGRREQDAGEKNR